MTANPRRPGFRLPWGGEADAQAGASAAVEDAAVDADQAVQPEAGGSTMEADVPDAGDGPAMSETNESAPAAETPSTDSPTTPAEPNEFLLSLVAAMRNVADEARNGSLAELRTSIDRRVEELRSSAAQQTEELRRRADLDLEGIGDWERGEIERIRGEAEERRGARRQALEQQLADHERATERQIEQTQQRLEQHERELAAFFEGLGDMTDPAAFVAAARRMPAPPDLESGLQVSPTAEHSESTPGSAPRETLKARLEAMGMDRSTGAVAAEPAAPESATNGTESPAAPEDGTAATTPEAVTPGGTSDAALAERLAELDQRLGEVATPEPAPSTAPAATATPSGETSTAIVVKGLGSFGAITSFKQALERVDGVKGVTLSLGPTGEFVYRASHAAEFDVPAAIRSIEGQGVAIEADDGGLRVTVSRGR